MHFTKLFRILFFHVVEVLPSVFSDYVSELKKLKRGYLICGAVLILNLLLLQVQGDAYKIRGHCCNSHVQVLQMHVRGVSIQQVVQQVTGIFGGFFFCFWQIMFKNCDLFNSSFKKTKTNQQVIDDARVMFRDISSALVLTIPVRKMLS